MTYTLVQGDYGFNFNFTLTDSTGAVLDLTNATSITFTAICTTNSSTITGSCVVDVAASGTCHFTPATASVTNVPPGTYTWEVCVVYPTKTLTPIGSANIVVQQKY